MSLKAIDPSGKTTRHDKYAMDGELRSLVWRYEPLAEGGRVEVTLTRDGVEDVVQTIEDPSADERVSLNVESPRLVTGAIVTGEGQPIAGMQVRLNRGGGGIAIAKSDAKGKFTIPVFAGSHGLSVLANEQFAPIVWR